MSSPEFQSDKWLDAELRNVPVPEQLTQRLEQIAVLDDGQLDAAVRHVAVPSGLQGRLLRMARPRRPVGRQLALAASLFVAVGLWFAGALASLLMVTYPPPPEPHRPLLSAVSLELGSVTTEDAERLGPNVEIGPPDADAGVSALADHWLRGPIEELFRQEHEALSSWPAGHRPVRLAEVADFDGLLLDVTLLGLGDLLADAAIDELPDLHKVASPAPRGVDAPLDLVSKFFLLRYGVFPRVQPAAYPSSQVPLAGEVSSYELTRNYLSDGEFPPSDKVRTEEFLAALDYGFDRPAKRPLNLLVATGPSPWRPRPAPEQRNPEQRGADPRGAPRRGPQLLQIGVQARDLPTRPRRATHLTVAVDVSGSMRMGNRLAMVKHALEQMVAQLGPQDRVSLVAFSEQAYPLVEDAGPQESDELLRAISSLEVGSATNVGAGLLVACSVASRGRVARQAAHRVVVVTDGLADMDFRTTEHVERLLRSPAAVRLQLYLIDVSQDMDSEGQLLDFAQRVAEKVHHASNTDQVRWSLLEILTGRRQVVAADVVLTVRFNLNTVASYRVFGHEPTVLAGLMPVRVEVDLHSGQAGTVLYELELLPGKEPEIAVAQLQWREPRNGTPRQLSRRITRAQFVSSPAEVPVSLQMAAIAAGAAEVLRKSPFASHLSAADLLDAARQISYPEGQHPAFCNLLSLLEQVNQLRPRRLAPRAGPTR